MTFFFTVSETTVSRRRVRNFLLWKVAVGRIQDNGPANVRYCLDRYNLSSAAYSETIATMIGTILKRGCMFEADRCPSPLLRFFGRRLFKMAYHDDSPTRESMGNLGIDLTESIGKGNPFCKSYSGDACDSSNFQSHFSEGSENTYSGAMQRRAAVRPEYRAVEVGEDVNNAKRKKNAN